MRRKARYLRVVEVLMRYLPASNTGVRGQVDESRFNPPRRVPWQFGAKVVATIFTKHRRNPSLVTGSSRMIVDRSDVLEPFGTVGLWNRVRCYWLFAF